MKKFYDTNAILTLQERAFEEKFVISSVTLMEIEHIKVSRNKDEAVKYQARKAIHLLNEHQDLYDVVIYDMKAKKILDKLKVDEDPDNKILACAKLFSKKEGIVFVTDDICCKTLASNLFGLESEVVGEINVENYKGFKEVKMTEEEMAYFYEHPSENTYELNTNEYILIKGKFGNNVKDIYRWNGETYVELNRNKVTSLMFGTVKPYNEDDYQKMALDNLLTNKISVLTGAAGTGKSYLAIGTMFYKLSKHEINKLIIFCNTCATLNSAKLGFYPGSKDEKLLDSQIGNMLASKLGGKDALLELIADGTIELLPMSDIRGYDTTGMNACVYIPESQNLDIELMRLALQRIGEDCYCILDGDYNAQVDSVQYAGSRNGMRRAIEVFTGEEYFGVVELQNIYRSRIANKAQEM